MRYGGGSNSEDESASSSSSGSSSESESDSEDEEETRDPSIVKPQPGSKGKFGFNDEPMFDSLEWQHPDDLPTEQKECLGYGPTGADTFSMRSFMDALAHVQAALEETQSQLATVQAERDELSKQLYSEVCRRLTCLLVGFLLTVIRKWTKS